ncbi:MAG: uroporphyrinogen decarboxylase family protein [Planctomycetota bacterium]
MSIATMTSRERVNAAFERRDQDRVPRHDTFWPDTIRRWAGEGLEGGQARVYELLGNDIQRLHMPWPGVHSSEIILGEDDKTVTKRDIHGRIGRWWKDREGTPEHLGFECDSREKWESTYKPLLLKAKHTPDLDTLQRTYRTGHEAEHWMCMTGFEPFECIRALIGDEEAAIAMATDPEWIVDLAVTYTDRMIVIYQRALDAGLTCDGLWTYGDMAYNHATFCSPAMYRELIWPQHIRLVEFAHAHDMKFIYHSDGNINGVIDLFLEAGFDCLQPLEAKAGMDVCELCPEYGDRLAFFGNIDIMKLSTNDRTVIEQEVRGKLDAGKLTRGYLYHSDHSVPPTVSWTTYQFLIEFLEHYGRYDR